MSEGRTENTVLPWILILTHGNLGQALIESASMILGQLANVMALPLNVGDDPEVYRQRVEQVLSVMPEGSLVLVDLFGGTPFNSIVLAAQRKHALAVAGVNLSMLIEATIERQSLTGDELLEAAVKAGYDGIVNVTKTMTNRTQRDSAFLSK